MTGRESVPFALSVLVAVSVVACLAEITDAAIAKHESADNQRRLCPAVASFVGAAAASIMKTVVPDSPTFS